MEDSSLHMAVRMVTWPTIGMPWMSARGFPGKRLEPMRAGIMAMIFMRRLLSGVG